MERAIQWIDDAIEQALRGQRPGPPKLTAAIRHAVFPGGSRLRPRLLRAVHEAVGGSDPEAMRACAVALELVHCGSLVHDDLPCFDDAATRRGAPSVHRQFGEALAILTGDALIVLAFQALVASPHRLDAMVRELARSTGHPAGIIAGQAWESEQRVRLATYHEAKTAALFEAACALGALSAREDPAPWRDVGRLLGRAYQIADDVADATGADHGKPAFRDRELGRPSAAVELGTGPSLERVEALLGDAIHAVPPCPGQGELRRWLASASLGALAVRSPTTEGTAAVALRR